MSSKKKEEKIKVKFSSQPKEKVEVVLDESTQQESVGINFEDVLSKSNPIENLAPYTIRVKNLTDEKIYDVDLFNYEHEKQKKIEYSCVHGVSYEYFLRILASYDKPSELIKMMRFSAFCDYHKFQNKQLRNCIRTIYTKLDGCSASIPTEIAIYMNAYQMQGNIIDVPISDNQRIKFSNQLQLRLDYLMPETEMVIHLFPVKID
jgi:hypothetical protein